MIRVSVVVPAYNESQTIIGLLETVREQRVDGVEFEIIVVDDGSGDGTGDLLEAHDGLYDKLIRRPVNGGKGAAVLDALTVASGDYILFQDADREYHPTQYVDLLRPILEFDAEIVIGSRLVAPSFTRVSYFWHKVGNRSITLLFNIFYNTTFTDIYSCYLLYRRDLVDPLSLTTRGWDQQAEILGRAVRKADIIYEVPISYYGRTYAEGKKIRATDSIPVIWAIFKTRFKT